MRRCMYAIWLTPACLSMVFSVECYLLCSISPPYMIQPERGSARYSGWIAMFDQHATPWNKRESSFVKLSCRVMSPSVYCDSPTTLENVPYSSKAIAGSAWVWICRSIWGRMQRIRVENFLPKSLHLEALDKENALTTTEKGFWHLRASDSFFQSAKSAQHQNQSGKTTEDLSMTKKVHMWNIGQRWFSSSYCSLDALIAKGLQHKGLPFSPQKGIKKPESSPSSHWICFYILSRSPPSLLRLHHFLSCSQNVLACPARWPQNSGALCNSWKWFWGPQSWDIHISSMA